MMNTSNPVSLKVTSKYVHSVAIVLLALSACGKQEVPPVDAKESATQSTAHEGHATSASPKLPAGKLWPTDPPLRAAMTRIEGLVERSEAEYGNGTFKEADAKSVAAQVEKDVQHMIENCKLEPEADAALHVLIARMMSAAQALKTNPTSPGGVPVLASVVHEYRATFDHTAGEPAPQ